MFTIQSKSAQPQQLARPQIHSKTKIFLTGAVFLMTISMSGCETMNENPGVSAGIAVVGGYFICKAAGGKDGACAAAAVAAGAVTYGYLRSQMQEIQEIDNVEVSPCKATDSSREAYCVRMDSRAVKFSSGSANISRESMGTLTQVAGIIKRSPNTLVYVEGHTDSDGSEAFNQRLSEERALSVRDIFQESGIELQRMLALGYGESRPIADDSQDSSMKALNRRVEVRVEGENGQ